MSGLESVDSCAQSAAQDRLLMSRALALAEQGLFTTTPNPRVGCVLARDGEVIGEGFHARAGAAHAEVNALADARARGHDPRGATAYVTLEPCNHHGRTGPCTEALIAAGVSRVVAAMRDPNPQAHRGGERLRAAGIEVDVGTLEDEARFLNRGFVSRMQRGRPWVRLKVAASLDGRTALPHGESRWITGPLARADGHRLRAQACAILTGSGTVLADDPALTVREVPTSRQPRVIVVDSAAVIPSDARVLHSPGAWVVTARPVVRDWPAGVETLSLPGPHGVDLAALMAELGRREVNELHVEAGARLNGALLRAQLVDEIVVYMAPSLLGDPARGIADLALDRLAGRIDLVIRSIEPVGADWRIWALVQTEGR